VCARVFPLKAPFACQQLHQNMFAKGRQLNAQSQVRQPVMSGSSWKEQSLDDSRYHMLNSQMQPSQQNSGLHKAQHQTYSSKPNQEAHDRRLLAKPQQLFRQNYGKISHNVHIQT
jgi:hypothetical protein